MQGDNQNNTSLDEHRRPSLLIAFIWAYGMPTVLLAIVIALVACIVATLYPLAHHLRVIMLSRLQGEEIPEISRLVFIYYGLGLFAGLCVLTLCKLVFARLDSKVDETERPSFSEASPPPPAPTPVERETIGWEGFDSDDPKYPEELDIAFQAWRAVSLNPGKGTVKEQLANWIRANYRGQSSAAIERIVTIANWDKSGGRPRQS